MGKHKLKKIKCWQWCYCAPNGYPLVRTIADTRKDSREYLELYDKALGEHSYKDYESRGYSCHRVFFILTPKSK